MIIEDKLKSYNYNTARLDWLKVEVQNLQDRIELLKKELKRTEGIKETDEETIEALTFGNRSLDGQSTGKGSPNRYKLENIALRYKEEQRELEKPRESEDIISEIRQLRGKINNYYNEIGELKKEIACVKACMKVLTREERFVIERQYFDGLQWRFICVEYMKEFGEPKEERTLKSYRQRAIKKMEAVCDMP